MGNKKQPGIICEGIILVEDDMYREHEMPNNTDLVLEFNIKNNYNEKIKSIATVFTTNLKLITPTEDKKENHDENAKVLFKLFFKYVGLYKVLGEDPNIDISDFLEKISPHIMLPYVREHISSMTAKSGISPIILPPINLVALLKDGAAKLTLKQK